MAGLVESLEDVGGGVGSGGAVAMDWRSGGAPCLDEGRRAMDGEGRPLILISSI